MIFVVIVIVAYAYGLVSQKKMYFPANAIDEAYYALITKYGGLKPFVELEEKKQTKIEDCTNGQNVMVALVLGQSNAANYSNRRSRAGKNVFNYYSGHCYAASDPLLGASGGGGSLWTKFGDIIIQEKLYKRVVLINLSMGGSTVRRWGPGGKLFGSVEKVVNELKENGISFTHVFWHQGESDCRYSTTSSQYRERFLSLLEGLRGLGIEAPVYVAKVSKNPRACEVLHRAQGDLVNPDKGIMSGPDIDSIESRYDGVHLSYRGIQEAARLWYQAIKESQ